MRDYSFSHFITILQTPNRKGESMLLKSEETANSIKPCEFVTKEQ